MQDINIGRFQVNSSTRKYSDGYIAEYYYIDGTALDPSSFTETDPTTGQLIPKKYSGSFGTNGFYLNFSDNSAATAAAIGKDFSGNGHNFTPSNISVTAGTGNDSLEDTPTNNWCTANPLDAGSSSLVFSNGNLDIGSASGNWTDCRSTFAVSSGKWYWETKINTGASLRPFVGILSSSVRPASNSGSTTEQLGITTNSYAYWTLNGTLRYNSGNIKSVGKFVVFESVKQVIKAFFVCHCLAGCLAAWLACPLSGWPGPWLAAGDCGLFCF